MKLFLRAGWSSFVVIALLAATAHADSRARTSTVDKLLSTDGSFGGCMVRLVDVTHPLNCPNKWFTLDCEGIFLSKEAGRRNLELAQMALALERSITVFFSDDQLINGHCVVDRVDLE